VNPFALKSSSQLGIFAENVPLPFIPLKRPVHSLRLNMRKLGL